LKTFWITQSKVFPRKLHAGVLLTFSTLYESAGGSRGGAGRTSFIMLPLPSICTHEPFFFFAFSFSWSNQISPVWAWTSTIESHSTNYYNKITPNFSESK